MAERRLRVLAIAQQPAQYQAPLFRRMAARRRSGIAGGVLHSARGGSGARSGVRGNGAVTITPYVVDNDWGWSRRRKLIVRRRVRPWGATDAVGVVLFCAKLQPWKRPFDLLEAFAKSGISEALLVFADEGPLRGGLKARGARRGLGF